MAKITLVEFLHPLKNKGMRANALSCLYFLEKQEEIESVTVEQLRTKLKSARVKNAARANLADTLSKSAPYVESAGHAGSKMLWKLTSTGEKHVRDLLDIPQEQIEVQHQLSSLDAVIKRVKSNDVQEYVKEAVKCIRCDARRACVVFLWVGAIRGIQVQLLAYPKSKLNTAIKKHYPKAKEIKKIDDFAYVNEATQLLAAEELGLYDKNERSVLTDCLNLRNRCGHPGKYTPGVNKVASFIEDMTQISLK